MTDQWSVAPDSWRANSSDVVLPRYAYASWFSRVAAALIDSIPPLILLVCGTGLLLGVRVTECAAGTEYDLGPYCTTGSSAIGLSAFLLAALLSAIYYVWNFGYRQGTRGASIGKSLMRFQVLSEKTGKPIGFGLSFVRQIAHVVDAAVCFVGFLVPLWDAKRQTIADKLMATVCLPVHADR